ncbi:uncharacterized protein LOC141890284 isoform X2 [Acropora palmata]|uniref:uncharacterized protein LOC141890284 isoform X2 n=1 Tax=Acropora palmata TaxID=6131 RepID=UPI003DA129B7
MSENQVYFFLHFVRELGTPAPELIVRGGERDPLDCLLTIAEVSNYDEAMRDPDFELESRYDFILNDNGEIIRRLSNDVRKAIDVLNEYTGSGASKFSHVNGSYKRKVSEAKGEGKSGQAALKHKKLEDPFPPGRRSPRFIQPRLHASAINGKVQHYGR